MHMGVCQLVSLSVGQYPRPSLGLTEYTGWIDNMFFSVAYMIRTDVWVCQGVIQTKTISQVPSPLTGSEQGLSIVILNAAQRSEDSEILAFKLAYSQASILDSPLRSE